MALKVLVTGFDPFGGEKINPAYQAIKLLPETIEDAELIKAVLPVEFRRVAQVLEGLIEKHRPEIVICVGQAGGRSSISIERVAINLQDALSPDNADNTPTDEEIIPRGPAAYFSSLPTRAIVQTLQDNGIAAALSYSAGTYVYNDIMYHLLHWLDTRYSGMVGGFIHVPFAPEQVVNMKEIRPSMSIATIAQGLELAVATTIKDFKRNM